jgi:hypothetical protein
VQTCCALDTQASQLVKSEGALAFWKAFGAGFNIIQ